MNSSVPSCVVRSFTELESFLHSLGPPESGLKRVYRGQTKEYVDADEHEPLLLPSGARHSFRATWDPAYERVIAGYVGQLDFYDSPADWKNSVVWMPALIQHYGYGSFFLDVTSNVSVALWFSVFKYCEQWVHTPIRVPGEATIDGRIRASWYRRLTDEDTREHPPVLYVFDVPLWSGTLSLSRGHLVDLLADSEGTKLAAIAARLRVQSASLIYAYSPPPEGRNLSDLLRAVVHLSPELTSETLPEFGRTTSEMFPGPSRDELYSFLLNLPARFRVDPAVLEHPLSLPFYLDGPPAATGGIIALPTISPVLFHPHLLALLRQSHQTEFAVQADGDVHRLREATPILLETSFQEILPGAGTGEGYSGWIESALPIGIADRLQDRSTANVYIEFSSLDVFPAVLADVDDLPRGIWIARKHPHYAVTLCAHDRNRSPGFGTTHWRYDTLAGKFVMTDGHPDLFTQARKALFAALTLLRDLSPGYKPPAMHGMALEEIFFPRSLFEPQMGMATVEHVGGMDYLIPRALDGNVYKGARFTYEPENSANIDEAEIMTALDSCFDEIRDRYYLVPLGDALCAFHLDAERFERVVEIASAAIDAAAGWALPGMVTELQCMRAWSLARIGQNQAACRDLAAHFTALQTDQHRSQLEREIARVVAVNDALGCPPIAPIGAPSSQPRTREL